MNFKIYKIHYILFFFGVSCQTGFAQFVGGNAEGSASSDISNSICSSFSVNPFAGGIGSGEAFQEVSPFGCPVSSVNPFSGGTGSGSTYNQSISILCDVVTVNPFSGGSGNGDSFFENTTISCPVITVNPYSGGNGNGNSYSGFIAIVCPVITVNPYGGGSGDGESFFDFSVSPCPVITVNPYSGGESEGSGKVDLTVFSCPVVTVNPFSGGLGEGSSWVDIHPVICSSISVNPFSGGSSGGYAVDCVMVNNPITCWPLPIDLITFNSFCEDEKLYLRWITLSERNNNYFTIEKSLDLVNWHIVGEVQGAGNSNELLTYSFKINPILGEEPYYRLSQTDYDGQFEIFKPIQVRNCIEIHDKFLVYPNPSNGTFQFDVAVSDLVSLEIFNSLGEKVPFIKDVTKETYHLNQKPGIYYIYIQTNNQVFVEVLVIQ